MENSLDALRQILNITPLAQLLFVEETLEAVSPEAQRLLPGLRPGDSAAAVFGEALEDFRRFQGSGSILFSADLGGFRCDVTVSGLRDACLATVTAAQEDRDNITMLSLAERTRQPIASILSVTPQLLPQLEGEERTMDRVSVVNQGLYRLMQITENLEVYAQGRIVLHRRPVELGNWFQDLTDHMAPLFEAADRTLTYQQPEGICMCSMDPEYMRLAVLNLVSNAIKFSRAGGTIHLNIRRTGSRLWISVRDQGVGIPTDQMGLVFQRSEHRGLLPDPRWGVGLGLPVARKIVEAHGGRIMLESQENVGTSVHLALEACANGGQLSLRSPVELPGGRAGESSGIDPVLVLLADALPAAVFDTRNVDL